jgi:rRNA maturation endonuclease Nob1
MASNPKKNWCKKCGRECPKERNWCISCGLEYLKELARKNESAKANPEDTKLLGDDIK